MIHLDLYQILEIILGAFSIWVGIYLLSRNPYSGLSWAVFFFLFGFGITIHADPILQNSRSLHEYIIWQKITDWPLFMIPVAYFHSSIQGRKLKNRNKVLLYIGYILAMIFFTADVHGGLILKENILRFENYKRYDGFGPGPFLIPSVLFGCIYMAVGLGNFLRYIKDGFYKYALPAIAGLFYVATGLFSIVGYYIKMDLGGYIFTIGTTVGSLFYIYSIIKFHLFSPSEKIIFDRNFLYKTVAVFFILALYFLIYTVSGLSLNFEGLIFLTMLVILLLLSHSFYDWFCTFINDIIYNISSGLSVVNDQEVFQVLKNYNDMEKLESSSLLRLKIIRERIVKEKKFSVDALREIIKEGIEYFKPDANCYRRVKKNLKYHLLKMFVFDEAEEGQILWELGFEEYPVKIMSQERKYRSPLFETKSPSDYTYTSRNAFLALKKEAIHDITWRISYLEKQRNRRSGLR